MRSTRRGLLAAGGAALAGVTGCLGSSSAVHYPDDAGANAGGATDTAGVGSGHARNRVAADPGPDALAERTRAIVTDVRWFATEYDAAIETTIEANEAVVTTIDEAKARIREAGSTPAEVIGDLETVTGAAAETADEALAPHFDPASHIEALATRHLEYVRRFAGRGDTERVLEELTRMRTSFGSLSNATGLERRYSRAPIHNHLQRRLLGGDPIDWIVRLQHPPTGFDGFAYTPEHHLPPDSDYGPLTFRGPAIDRRRRAELDAALGPVRTPEDRTDELYVVVSDRPKGEFAGPVRDLPGPGAAMYVQRYPDPAAVETAIDRITAEADTEGTARVLGSTLWYRLYFPDGNAVTYGYLGRAGSFLFAFGFSGTAWEERVSWKETLPATWVANE